MGKMLVTCNDRDLAMRSYSRLFGRGGPPAIGSTGPCLSDEKAKRPSLT